MGAAAGAEGAATAPKTDSACADRSTLGAIQTVTAPTANMPAAAPANILVCDFIAWLLDRRRPQVGLQAAILAEFA